MSKFKKKEIIILLLGCVLLILIGKYFNHNRIIEYKAVENQLEPVGEIVKDMKIEQPLPKISKLQNIEIQFATYDKAVKSTILIKIVDNSNILFSTILQGTEIKDNEYFNIEIDSIKTFQSNELKLIIEGVDGVSGNALTIWSSIQVEPFDSFKINGVDSNRVLNMKINTKGNESTTLQAYYKLFSILFVLTAIMYVSILLYRRLLSSKYINYVKIWLYRLNKYKIILLMLIFVVMVFILKINFSSFRNYELFIPNNIKEINQYDIGKHRGIRSDEWGVITPTQLGQGNLIEKYMSESNLYGKETRIQVVGLPIPTKDISLIGKPFTWGFLLFGNEIGYSWYYVSRLMSLIIFSFLLCKILLKDTKIASLGAFIIAFSPGIQWWNTSGAGLVELIIYFQVIVYSLYQIFHIDNNIKKKIINLILLLISTVGFSMGMYPAFQVPLFYLGITLIIGLYLENKNNIIFSRGNIRFLLCIIVLYTIIVLVSILQMKDDIYHILNTAYPGKRFVQGGGLTLEYLLHYIPTIKQLFRPLNYLNQSELSSFITLFPIPIIVYGTNWGIYNKNKIIKALAVFLGLSFLFMFIGFPKIISKITLMSMVTEARLYTVVGLSLTILILFLIKYSVENTRINIQYILYFIMMYIFIKKAPDISLWVSLHVFIIIVMIGALLLYLINRRKEVFSIIMIGITLFAGVPINPTNFGIKIMTQTNISKAITSINDKEQGVWLTLDDLWLSKYVIAQGGECFNALNYPPKLEAWEKLDKDRASVEIYNRYAHVQVELVDAAIGNKFELLGTDVFKVSLTLREIKELGIKYIMTKNKIPSLDLIYYEELDHIYIYDLTLYSFEDM